MPTPHLIHDPAASMTEDQFLELVMQASSLQQAGQEEEAIALYQTLASADLEGQYGAIARKALEAIDPSLDVTGQDETSLDLAMMDAAMASAASPTAASGLHRPAPERRGQGPRFVDLPVRQKQWIGFGASAAVSLMGCLGLGALLLGSVEAQLAARSQPSMTGAPAVSGATAGDADTSPAIAQPLWMQLAVQGAGIGALMLTAQALITLTLTRTIAAPLVRLKQAAQMLSQGQSEMPLEVDSTDEVGSLAIAFNQMSANFNASTDCMEQLVTQNEQEVEAQRQEAERLQKRVMELLLEIDGARQGNLTVRARVTDDEMGSVADAFNSTVASLQGLVLQVQEVASQVNQKVAVSDQSVGALADVATQQARSMTEALQSVKEMSISIEGVAATASQAASISRRASAAADAGGEAMEQTVLSINGLRGSVAETAKKVKRLTESSQEISKIVGLISEVSAKTNLLAFNASIEAVRAGEHGQGFRIVADEVRRLAEQVTHATQEIEQLVTGIQLETAEVLTMMEQGTEQVVTGSELVDKTRTTLASLVQTNQEIDGLLQSISASTASQTAVSAAVGETMQSVAILAQGSSEESVAVSEMLRQLLTVSNQLQHSVKQFQAQPS